MKLRPGALRILLLGLKEPFEVGKKVNGTLVFEKAGSVESFLTSRKIPGPPSVASQVHSTSITRLWLRGLCPGLVANASFSSGDFDLCPAPMVTSDYRSRRASIAAKKAIILGRSPPR